MRLSVQCTGHLRLSGCAINNVLLATYHIEEDVGEDPVVKAELSRAPDRPQRAKVSKDGLAGQDCEWDAEPPADDDDVEHPKYCEQNDLHI
eukprot:SAG11_NODE_5113_length_1659_cov_2.495513_2_plen_91_part_00